MKNQFKSIAIIIWLLSFASTNAMENPLPEKLGLLKTNLETLHEKLKDLRVKLEDLKDALVDDSNEECDSISRWSPFIQGEIQRAAEEREAFKKMITDQMFDWTPETSSILTKLINAFCAGISETTHLEPAMYVRTGETYDVYFQNRNPDIAEWEKRTIDVYRKESLKSPPPLPSNSGFIFGTEATSVRDLRKIPVSKYNNNKLKELENKSEADWSKLLFQQTSMTMDRIAIENCILNEFENYRFPNFKSAARKALLIYDDFMLDLVRKMDTDDAFKNNVAYTPGFFTPGKWGLGTSTFYDSVKKEADEILEERCKKSGCLDVSNKSYIKYLAKKRMDENRVISSNFPDKKRLKKRLKALNKAAKTGGRGLISYTNDVKKYPKFTDPYAIVFGHTCGTVLDRNLHKDLCDTRVMMIDLENEHHGNTLVASYSPIIDRITALAKKEKNIEKAYSLADCAYDIVSIVGGSTTGACRAVKGYLNPQTYVDAAVGVLGLGVFLATGAEPMDEFDIANVATMFPEKADPLFKMSDDYRQRCLDSAAAAQKLYEQRKEQFNKMPLDEKSAVIAEGVTTLLLPWAVPRALKLAGSAPGRKLISDLATIMKAPEGEGYLAGIGTIEKIAAKEGAGVAKVTNEVIKHNPSLLEQKSKSITQAIREIAKDVVETKDFGKIPCSTGEKCWLRLSADQLKKIGPRAGGASDIKAVKGTAKDAWEFFNAQVINTSIIEQKPGLFLGKNAEGIAFSYRAASSHSGPPTVGVTGIKGLRKIKFID